MEKLAISILNQKEPKKIINKIIRKKIKHVHYDVMNKAFVNNEAFKIKEIKDIVKNTQKHIVDVHLMVANPEKYIKGLRKIANYFSIHFEAVKKEKIEKILQKYQNVNIGIAIKPETSWKEIIPFVSRISHILIMSVEPGKGGQKFIESSLRKIKELKTYIQKNKLKILVEVDGGINNITGPQAIKSGADSLVSGSYLINNILKKNIREMILKEK